MARQSWVRRPFTPGHFFLGVKVPHNTSEKLKEYQKRYYQENKDKIKERHKKWAIENAERWKYLSKRYYKNNKEKIIALALKHREKKINWFVSFVGAVRLHCDRCKYDKSFAAIQLHHTNPKQKENVGDSLSFWVRNLGFKNFQKKILNTDFIILCANCHIELHAGLWEW